ncbi:uncharacterized protein alms1 [Fundulus diaphanus]
MEPQERAVAPSRWHGEDEMNGPDGQTGPPEARGQSNAMSPLEALQLDFQDSRLSPALPLLPLTSGLEHSVTGCSFFQQGDPEFAPLRAFPDVSVASERFHLPLQNSTAHSSEQSSLSQHPLAQATLLSEEGADDSSSAGNKGKQQEMAPLLSSDAAASTPEALPGEGGKELESQALPDPTDGNAGGIHGDETFFLRKDVPARQLLDLLQKEVGMQSSSSSSAVSSESQTSTKSKPRPTEAYKGVMFERQGPPGEASPSQLQEKQQEISNITSGSRRTQPDDSSEELHRQLLSEVRRLSSREATEEPKGPTPAPRSVTPSLKESRAKWSETPFPAGSEWVHRERHLWSSKNQTGSDGSYLGFLPQSQSTPAVFLAPLRFKGEAKLGQRFAVGSNDDVLYRSGTGTVSAGGRLPDSANRRAEDALQATDKVHSLPSFNYLQKVDAWRTKPSSERTPPLEGPALHRLSGVSPQRKGDEAGSHALNQGLTQQALRQPSTSQDAPQIPSSGGSSPGRGEAVGGAPSDLENKGSAAPPSASPFGRSQSLSSLSTVVMSADKRQQTNDVPGTKTSQSQTDAPPPGAAIQPSPLDSLGHFSDVSADREPSSSLDSYAEVKVGPSVGTSSVVSLELDNYAPYWTFKRPTASPPLPGPKELNIDERIPLYLQNLGIDQTPSKILTPFAPRGPIREPEFSPTDLCTIKGSSGSPSKSTQPSEGSSPHKGEFSRSSILSADSSISIPFSLDSLGPAASMSERFRARTSVTSDTEAAQRESRPVSCSQPDEPSHSSMLHPLQQQQQDSNHIDHRSESTSVAVGTEGNWALQNGGSTDQDAGNSFVSARALSDIRKLLSQAENMISTGSSTASSGPSAPHLFSGKDTFRPPETKASRLLSSSFSSSSSTGGDLKSHSSLPWARSSSDSMLTSEKSKQSSSARESLTSSWPPGNPSTQAVSVGPQGGAASNSAGTSVMSKSARRTEPEGCSAAPPDKTPTQPAAAGTQQLSWASADGAGVPEEEEKATPGDPGAESRSSSPVLGDADQGGMSDGSSESSLAVRVAKLLQNESPAAMASSTPSVTDQEEGKAREWIQSKVSGRQCEPLRLDAEDRWRIEEIKKELLLRNPMKSQGSTDTESSAASSVGVNKKKSPEEAEAFPTLVDANKQLGPGVDHPDPPTHLQSILHLDLEARVCEIAAREGLTLPKKRPPALTSVSIPAHRHSVASSAAPSPAPPLSPASDPLHLTELSTGTVPPTSSNMSLPPNLDEAARVPLAQPTRQPGSVYDQSASFSTRNQEVPSVSAPGNQKRQDTVGGRSEEPPPPTQAPDEPNVAVKHVSAHPLSHQTSESNPGLRTGRLPHVHFTLLPTAAAHTSSSAVPRPGAEAVPRQDLASPGDSSPAASSPDEGVGSSSPAERRDGRKPARDRRDAPTAFKAVAPQGSGITASSGSLTQPHSSAAPRSLYSAETPVPVLLPYKPRGSEELFYVPQTEAAVSFTDPSDTTLESSHPGSDDAVPPRFSSEVLGDQDPGLGRGVAIRHEEGIYSKRLKTPALRMQEPAGADASAAADGGAPALSRTPAPSSQASATVTARPPVHNHKVSKRDQGTSPIQGLRYKPTEPAPDRFHPAHIERVQTQVRERASPPPAPRQSSNTLDHLWQKFCEQWSKEESHPASDREASLLERLERLSRVIHGSHVREGQGYYLPEAPGRTQRAERNMGRRVGGGREADLPSLRRLQAEEPELPAESDSRVSNSSSQDHPFSPADRDRPESPSTLSGSTSTVDTARLIRAFGAARVRHPRSGASLSKLYGAIDKQREARERGRETKGDSSVTLTPSEASGTDASVVPDSASTPSTYTAVSPHRGPTRALTAKRAVRVVNKSIQAGELEIVHNGTRRHTRDVGTTFPSPGEARALEQISSSSSSTVGGRGGAGGRVPPKSNNSQKQKKSKRSPSKPYPKGVSWFISADSLRSEARKENRPGEPSAWRPNAAWFEPCSRVRPWREPLRQRQVHEDGSSQSHFIAQPELDPNPRTKISPSALARVSLQEALEMCRPEFISRSKQRVRCLALQADERRLQAVFSRERGLLFKQPGGAGRLPKPAGTALLRRAVPRKEMIQRSKLIYENLPEVRRRREEERRKAEYRSYRLNAQLYNKRITERVLGRRTAWH